MSKNQDVAGQIPCQSDRGRASTLPGEIDPRSGGIQTAGREVLGQHIKAFVTPREGLCVDPPN